MVGGVVSEFVTFVSEFVTFFYSSNFHVDVAPQFIPEDETAH